MQFLDRRGSTFDHNYKDCLFIIERKSSMIVLEEVIPQQLCCSHTEKSESGHFPGKPLGRSGSAAPKTVKTQPERNLKQTYGLP